MSDGQPDIRVLEEVRIFGPHCIAFINYSGSSYKAIPGFTIGIQMNGQMNEVQLGPAALCSTSWSGGFPGGLQERLCTKIYKDAVSADVK